MNDKNETSNEIFFYYLREKKEGDGSRKGHPFGCVAFKRDQDGTVSRGVSICSRRDSFNFKKARGLALQRLMRPLTKNVKFSERSMRGVSPFHEGSYIMVDPTEFEKRILKG